MNAEAVPRVARRRMKLEAKGKFRPHKKIARQLPAGSGDLASVPRGKDYVGGKKSGGVEEFSCARRCGIPHVIEYQIPDRALKR